jgi:3',5'-cyclic-AMP phosphodiesterase
MPRTWPQPYVDNSKVIQVIGDTHVTGQIAAGRFQKAINDMLGGSMLPTPSAALHVGDITDPGNTTEDAQAKAFLDQLPWPYFVNYGEHDNFQGNRAAGDAEYLASWNLPARAHSNDYGWFRAIALPPDPPQAEIDAAGAFAASSSLPCVLVSHRPIRGSLPGGTSPTYGTQPNTTNAGLYNSTDVAYQAMLNAQPNIKVVVCGHSHSAVDAPGNASLISVGARSVIQVNAGALAYTNTSKGATSDYLPGAYLVWRANLNAVDVWFREHGCGVWISGPGNTKVTTIAIPA